MTKFYNFASTRTIVLLKKYHQIGDLKISFPEWGMEAGKHVDILLFLDQVVYSGFFL